MNNEYNIFKYVNSNISVLDVAKKFPSFYNSLTKAGHDYATQCPTGHESQSGKSFKLVSHESKNFFICHSCNITGGSFDLAQLITNWDTNKVITWFVKEWKLDNKYLSVGANTRSEEELQLERDLQIRTTLLEAVVEWGKELLFTDVGKDALKYLTNNRRYAEDRIKETEFFYLPTAPEVRTFLHATFPSMAQDINNLKLVGFFGDNFRLAFPYRNHNGLITGLLKRATEPTGFDIETFDGNMHKNVRWDSTPGLVKDDLFGLYKVKNTDTVMLVEGYPDALYLPTLGCENVVAVGAGILSVKQTQSLQHRKIKNVIIALDNDGVGQQNTVKAIEMLLDHNITPFVLHPEDLGKFKDPDEFVRQYGIEDFMKLVERIISAGSWYVNFLYKIAGDSAVLRSKSYKKCIKIASQFNDSTAKEALVDALIKCSKTQRTIINSDISHLKKEATRIAKEQEQAKKAKEKAIEKAKRKAELAKKKEEELAEKQVKAKEGNLTIDLLKELTTHTVLPFQNAKTLEFGTYDQENNTIMYSSKEKILNFCKNLAIDKLDLLPTMQVIFDPQNRIKLDIDQHLINTFTSTPYMLRSPDQIEYDPKEQFPHIDFLLHNIIASKDTKMYTHFINWLAFCMQTLEKSQIAWVLKGKPGTGKNLFFDQIIKPFYGERQCQIIENQTMHSEFNGYLRNKMFIVFNEVAPSINDKYNIKSKLKAIITDETIMINEKFLTETPTKNYLNCMFFSNESIPINIEENDRRYCVVNTGTPLNQFGWFNYDTFTEDIHKELETFYDYILTYPVDRSSANHAIDSEEKLQLIEGSISQIDLFVSKLKEEDIDWFNDNQEKSPFKNPILVTEETFRNHAVDKDIALSLFQAIFKDSRITKPKFGSLVINKGLVSSKRRVHNDPTKFIPTYKLDEN